MRIGTDIDGVLADFSNSLFKIVNDLWPGRISSKYIVKDWNYTDVIAKNEWPIIWSEIQSTPFFWCDLKPLDGVLALQKFVKNHPEHEFYFITARTQTGEMSASVQTKMWLLDRGLFGNGRSHVKVVEHAAEKKAYIQSKELDYYLDDYAPTIEDLQNVPRTKSYLLSTHYNRASQAPKVYSVDEYLKIIEGNNAIWTGF